jgi:hypothetical protein
MAHHSKEALAGHVQLELQRLVAEVKGGVIKVQSRGHAWIGARLEVQIDNFLKRISETECQVGGRGNRRKIEIQRLCRRGARQVEHRYAIFRAERKDLLQRGVKRIRHAGTRG